MRRSNLLIIWLLSDLLIFITAYILAYFVRVGWIFSSAFAFNTYLKVTLIVAPFWLGLLISTRTFALLRKQMSKRTLAYIIYACLGTTALFALTYYFLFGLFFSRLLLVYAFVFSVVLTWAWHLLFGFISRLLMRGKNPTYPTLIIGTTREAADLIRNLQKNHSPLAPVAILDGRGSKEKEIEGVPVEGKLNKLEETITKYGITHIIQCSDLEQSINLLSACRNRNITYMLLPSVLGMIENDERIDTLEGKQVTSVRPKDSILGWFFR
jgi:FlaA1/EpsC-like NDP-sugar epimerase